MEAARLVLQYVSLAALAALVPALLALLLASADLRPLHDLARALRRHPLPGQAFLVASAVWLCIFAGEKPQTNGPPRGVSAPARASSRRSARPSESSRPQGGAFSRKAPAKASPGTTRRRRTPCASRGTTRSSAA